MRSSIECPLCLQSFADKFLLKKHIATCSLFFLHNFWSIHSYTFKFCDFSKLFGKYAEALSVSMINFVCCVMYYKNKNKNNFKINAEPVNTQDLPSSAHSSHAETSYDDNYYSVFSAKILDWSRFINGNRINRISDRERQVLNISIIMYIALNPIHTGGVL